MNNQLAQTGMQVQSMTSANGLLRIELPGGLMLTGPCLLAPLPPGFAARGSRLRSDSVPDHFWASGPDDAGLHEPA